MQLKRSMPRWSLKASGTYTFANNSANGTGAGAGTLVFAGGITGGTAGNTVLTLTGSNTNANTISGVIGNGTATTMAINLTGTGNWVLSGPNTYTGLTTISAGTLMAASNAALGSATATAAGLSFGGTATVSFTSATPAIASLTGFSGNSIVLGNAGATPAATTLSVGGNNASTTFGGNISDLKATNAAAVGSLTKTGTGTLTLSGTNSYNGVTTISAGTLQFGSEVSLYNNTPANWTATNVVVNSGTTAAFSVDNNGGSGGSGLFTATDIQTLVALGTATGGFKTGAIIGLDTTSANNGNFIYGNAIANPNGGTNTLGLNKLGGNTLTLSAANTYTGTTTVTLGTLQLGNVNAVQNSTVTLGASSSGLAFTTAGTYNLGGLSGSAGSILSDSATGTGNVTISVGSNNTSTTYSGGLSNGNSGGIGSLTKVGTGTLTLSGTNTYTGPTTVSTGTLKFAQEASLYNNQSAATWSTSNFIVNANATAAFNVGGGGEFNATDIQTLNGLGSGTGGFKSGSTLALDTTNAGGNFPYSNPIINPNSNVINLTKSGTGT